MKLSPIYSSIICAIALSACGGGDSGSASTNVSVIDGYLTGAVVYADINSNGTIDDGDYKIGVTSGEKGVIAVPNQYMQYPLIVKAIAGVTSDSDTGIVQTSYEMTASAGSTVITPFTTIAATNDTDLTALATSLGVDLKDLTGDYVARDSGKAHALARTLVKTYISQGDTDLIDDDLTNLTTSLNDYDGESWDDVIAESDGSTATAATDTSSNLSSYLTTTFGSAETAGVFASLNESNFATDEYNSNVYFVANSEDTTGLTGSMYMKNYGDAEYPTPGSYTVDNSTNALTVTFGTETDTAKVVYRTSMLSLLKDTSTKEGIIIGANDNNRYLFGTADDTTGVTNTDEGKDYTIKLDGKKLYYVLDDSTTTTPHFVEGSFTFTAASQDTSGLSGTVVDSLDSGTSYEYVINQDGTVTIYTEDSSEKFTINLEAKDVNGVYVAASWNSFTAGSDDTPDHYALITTDEDVADVIESKLK